MSKTKEEVEDIILYEIYKNLNIECDSRKEWLKKLLNRRYGKDPFKIKLTTDFFIINHKGKYHESAK